MQSREFSQFYGPKYLLFFHKILQVFIFGILVTSEQFHCPTLLVPLIIVCVRLADWLVVKY